MYQLNHIYGNSIGKAFQLDTEDDSTNYKIQFCISDLAVFMDISEIKMLLSVVRSSQQKLKCENCKCENAFHFIKFKTELAQVKFKLSKQQLSALEELILGVLFQIDYADLLSTNELK